MKLLLLFVKGDKGLVANKNGLFYFPDRKSTIKEEGLYECEVTIDKEKYVFVKGQPIKTALPSIEYAAKIIQNELFEKNIFKHVDDFKVKKIGVSNIVYVTRNGITQIGYMDEDGDFAAVTTYTGGTRRDFNKRNLYGVRKFSNVDEYETLRKEAIRKAVKELQGDVLQKVVATALLKESVYSWKKITKVVLIDGRFIVFETDSYGGKSTATYVYNEEHGVAKIERNADSCYDEKSESKEINLVEIKNYLVENHLGAEGLGEDPTYVKHISFMGNNIDVVCLNGNLFLDDISDEDKKKAADSFKKLEAYRKKVSKKISRSSISELVKLAPKQVLGLKGLK